MFFCSKQPSKDTARANIFMTLSTHLVRITEAYEYSVFSILRHGQTISNMAAGHYNPTGNEGTLDFPITLLTLIIIYYLFFEVFLKYSSIELYPWPGLLSASLKLLPVYEYVIVTLFCISLIANEVGHLFVCLLAICPICPYYSQIIYSGFLPIFFQCWRLNSGLLAC